MNHTSNHLNKINKINKTMIFIIMITMGIHKNKKFNKNYYREKMKKKLDKK